MNEKEYQQDYYQKHKEGIKKSSKEYYNKNKKNVLDRAYKYRKKNGFKHQKRYSLKRKYNLSSDEYDKMLAEQKGECLICGRINSDGSALAVDHCHETGVIRGLLCRKCNLGIGLFDDSVNLLEKAILYIKSRESKKRPVDLF